MGGVIIFIWRYSSYVFSAGKQKQARFIAFQSVPVGGKE
ncbi:GTP cyclohydrolase [Photobacterium sp. GB-50]|nr:GTP cyclohydrolase [Photobacterium sp. GB-210]PSV53625.1 GTP cyclohydrolase [Photobacterium sp. GB-1]PSW72575.1 GTP cyclohydrolase [Photobacterium sp. GB-50]